MDGLAVCSLSTAAAAFCAMAGLQVFAYIVDSLEVKGKGVGRAGIEGKDDVLINVAAKDSMTNKNEFMFVYCDLLTHYYN